MSSVTTTSLTLLPIELVLLPIMETKNITLLMKC